MGTKGLLALAIAAAGTTLLTLAVVKLIEGRKATVDADDFIDEDQLADEDVSVYGTPEDDGAGAPPDEAIEDFVKSDPDNEIKVEATVDKSEDTATAENSKEEV